MELGIAGKTKDKPIKLHRKGFQLGKHHLSMIAKTNMMHLQGLLLRVRCGRAADEMSLICHEAREIN